MINDILDLLNPNIQFTSAGTFYKTRPTNETADGMPFNYEYVNPYSNTWQRLFDNIQTSDSGEVAIRTHDNLGAEVNKSYFKLADGNMYLAMEIQTDYQAAGKQALRLFGTPVTVEYVIRLIKIQNPWGV